MILRKTESKDIDGVTYEVTALGGFQGLETFAKLVKLIGPVIANKDDLTKALQGLDPTELVVLAKTFAACTHVTPQPNVEDAAKVGGPLDKIFDLHFSQNYGRMMKWLYFCIDLNFGDFLKGSGQELLGKLVANQ